jgi:hypothetical protein
VVFELGCREEDGIDDHRDGRKAAPSVQGLTVEHYNNNTLKKYQCTDGCDLSEEPFSATACKVEVAIEVVGEDTVDDQSSSRGVYS